MRHLVAPAVLCVLTGCGAAGAAAPPIDAPHAATVRSEVRAMTDAIARDVSREGPTGWLPYLAHAPEFLWVADGKVVIQNADAADAFVRGFARAVPHVSLTWGDVRVDPIDLDHALVAAPCHEELTDAGGAKKSWVGFFTGVAVRSPRGWQLLDGHWSSEGPR